MEQEFELIEKAMDKQAFLEACVDECGSIRFSKNNIKVGYHVKLDKFGSVEVIGAGPQNITYRILSGGAKNMVLKAVYAEIKGSSRLAVTTSQVKPVDDADPNTFCRAAAVTGVSASPSR